MGTVLVIVNGLPSGKIAIQRALQFVLDSSDEGYSVKMFLEGEAVIAAQKRHKTVEMSASFDESIRDCKKLIKIAIARGAKVKICEKCAQWKSVTQNKLYHGVEVPAIINGMRDLARWVQECEKIAFLDGDSFKCKINEQIKNKEC